jgi:hypothetical protein
MKMIQKWSEKWAENGPKRPTVNDPIVLTWILCHEVTACSELSYPYISIRACAIQKRICETQRFWAWTRASLRKWRSESQWQDLFNPQEIRSIILLHATRSHHKDKDDLVQSHYLRHRESVVPDCQCCKISKKLRLRICAYLHKTRWKKLERMQIQV